MRTPVRSSLIRLSQFLIALSVGVVVAACNANGDDPHPLKFYGPIAAGEIGPDVDLTNQVLGFAFPLMKNTSRDPVHLKGVELMNVPDGVEIVKYRILALKDTNGELLGSFPVSGKGNYDSYPDYPIDEVAIEPKSEGRYYAVVYLRVLRHVVGHASGCKVVLEQNGETFDQTGSCDFTFGP